MEPHPVCDTESARVKPAEWQGRYKEKKGRVTEEKDGYNDSSVTVLQNCALLRA